MEQIVKYFPELTAHQIDQFKQLYPIYSEWNGKINVISRKDIENLYLHHVLHSLAIARCIKFPKGARVLDVGTGGGFPGIPLAILFPETEFLLCDSINKKLIVAREVVRGIGLKNVRDQHCRAEALTEKFDFIVSRAVMELSLFVSMMWNNLDTQGQEGKGILYLKGGDIKNEVEECIKRNRINRSDINILDISQLFCEPYFLEKKVVYIRK